MVRQTLITALALAVLSVGGCVQPAPGPLPDVPQPSVTNGSWAALADRVEAGKVADTDELVRIAAQLVKDGDVQAADFDRALPGIVAEKNAALTEERRVMIAKALRAIK